MDATTRPILDRLTDAIRGAEDGHGAARRAVWERALLDVRAERGPRATAPGVDDANLANESTPPGAVDRARGLLVELEAGVKLGELESAFLDIPIAPTLREFFAAVEPESVPDLARTRAWDLAQSTGRLEAAKWGIVLGTLRPGPEHVGALLTFALHPELARYALPPLVHVAAYEPEIADRVWALYPDTTGFATVSFAQHFLAEPTWRDRPGFALGVVGHALRHSLKSVLSVPFATHLDLGPVWEAARDDDDALETAVLLMNALIYDSAGYPADARIGAVERVYRSYLSLLRSRDPDVRVLSALQAVSEFLAEPRASDGIQDREWRREEVESALAEHVDDQVVRDALAEPATRSLGLHVVEGRALTHLLPDVMALGSRALDAHAAHVLARYGGDAELRFLARSLPEIVDLDARSEGALGTSSEVHESTPEDRLVAEITAGMGRLATDDAIGILKRAARDRHPWVRAAACDSLAGLPRVSWDDELRALVRERLDDSPDYVAKEARRAARAGGIEVEE